MSVIYQPKGKAREYSPLALNVYMECSHGCRYCYGPNCIRKNEASYFVRPFPRKDLDVKLAKELKYDQPKDQVLLSFIGDAYCDAVDGNEMTRKCLELLLEAHSPVAVLTKGGRRCLADLDLFKAFDEHIQVGATLTFSDEGLSAEWEPGAASPTERLETLKTLHDAGVRTFASFEPVIDPAESFKMIERAVGIVDVFKVGKLNNYRGLDRAIDWTAFLERVVSTLRDAGAAFYIKHDLRQAAPSVRLYGNEVLPDEHNVH